MNDPQSQVANDVADDAYADARSWALENDRNLKRWARTGWIAACVATVIALLEALALIALTPLKTSVPYTILVDRTTGYTQILSGTHPQTIKPQSALTKSMLAQYVIARESYDIDTIRGQYRRVGLWSAEAARKDYLELMQPNNPASPMNALPRDAIVEARVTSVDLDGEQSARVRFTTERPDSNTTNTDKRWWVVDVKFHYATEPTTADDRLVNPLGFAVTRYRRFQETPPPVDTGVSPAAALPRDRDIVSGAGTLQPQISPAINP